MKFTALFAVILFSACALSQAIKEPGATAPGIKDRSAVAPPPIVNTTSSSSAGQLAKIEQQTARVHASKPVRHSNTVAATPALDLGKNKPIHATRSPQAGLPAKH